MDCMSAVETVSDVNNTFLSRREITCNFPGLGGRLKKLDAVDMVAGELGLDGKTVIPVSMTSHVGKPLMTGTFYVYDDAELAKRQVNPTIFSRLERAQKKAKEAQAAEDSQAEAADSQEGQAAGAEAASDAPAKDGKGQQ